MPDGGGGTNPPDKPYQVKTLTGDDATDTATLQAARDSGLEVLFAFSSGTGVGRVILGNYKGQ